MFKELNPLLHSELRLAGMSLLRGGGLCLYPPADQSYGRKPERADRQTQQGGICGGDKDF